MRLPAPLGESSPKEEAVLSILTLISEWDTPRARSFLRQHAANAEQATATSGNIYLHTYFELDLALF